MCSLSRRLAVASLVLVVGGFASAGQRTSLASSPELRSAVKQLFDQSWEKTSDGLMIGAQNYRKADAIAWRRAFGGLPVARGVYRFRSHEEADEWLWRMMARSSLTRPRP